MALLVQLESTHAWKVIIPNKEHQIMLLGWVHIINFFCSPDSFSPLVYLPVTLVHSWMIGWVGLGCKLHCNSQSLDIGFRAWPLQWCVESWFWHYFVIVVLKTEWQEHQPDSNMIVELLFFVVCFPVLFQTSAYSQTQSIRTQINRVSVLRGLNLEKM